MSNSLFIEVVEFKPVKGLDSAFGFTASDDYGSAFNNSFESLDDFKKKFPTDDSLVDHILDLREFEGSGGRNENGELELEAVSAIYLDDEIFASR